MLFQPLVDRSLLAVSSLSLASTGAEPAGSSVELDKRGGGGGVYQHGSGGGGDYSQSGLEGKHKLGFGHHSPHKQRKGHGHGYTHDKSPHHQHYPPWWQRRRPSKHQCRAKHCPCPPHTKAVCKHGKCAFGESSFRFLEGHKSEAEGGGAAREKGAHLGAVLVQQSATMASSFTVTSASPSGAATLTTAPTTSPTRIPSAPRTTSVAPVRLPLSLLLFRAGSCSAKRTVELQRANLLCPLPSLQQSAITATSSRTTAASRSRSTSISPELRQVLLVGFSSLSCSVLSSALILGFIHSARFALVPCILFIDIRASVVR